MAAFDDAFARLINVEKGYWNDPAGGPTMYGVTETVARANGYNGDMHQLPLSLAKQIARARYWDVFQCDQFDAAVAFQVFDAAYNGGHPAQWLQRAVGVAEDGRIGAQTIAAVRQADPWKIIALFNSYRLCYMVSCKNFRENSAGWALRIASNLTIAPLT